MEAHNTHTDGAVDLLTPQMDEGTAVAVHASDSPFYAAAARHELQQTLAESEAACQQQLHCRCSTPQGKTHWSCVLARVRSLAVGDRVDGPLAGRCAALTHRH